MLNDITFGQYFETSSIIHRIDPRIKILLLINQIVFIFLSKNLYSLFVALIFAFLVIFLSKVPLKMYLKNLKAILPIIIFTAVLNLFYGNSGKLLWSFWKLKITTGGIFNSVFLTTRIFLLIVVSAVLTYTTTPNDLTDAIERLLSPLRFIGLKNAVHTLAMMMTIALRFIPTIIEETDKIMKAQTARGADFDTGGLIKKAKAMIPLLIPLFISSFRRADELALAMECRGYHGGEGRTKLKELKFSGVDIRAFVIFALLAILNSPFYNNIIC